MGKSGGSSVAPLLSYLNASLQKHHLFKDSPFNKVRIFSDVSLFSKGCKTIQNNININTSKESIENSNILNKM